MNTLISPPKPLGMLEFVCLIAMMFSSIAFSIDAMLPALPDIAKELTPNNTNSAQLIISAFVIGMGVGTFFAGPLSDSFGRKPIILWGGALYISGALLAWSSQSLELILIGRAIQGLGAAGPRVASLAVIRDLFSGREMARIVSLAMLVFTLVPAAAPLIGSVIIDAFGWRSIFWAFVVFSVLSVAWFGMRQSETLPEKDRRKLNFAELWSAVLEILQNKLVVLSILAQSLIFAMLFGTIASIQPTFDIAFSKSESFPYWFASIALISAIPSFVNAKLVVTLGMRRLIKSALVFEVILTGIVAISITTLEMPITILFWMYFLWSVSVFSTLGFTIGNLNALALEPMGHIAGMTASVMGAISTLIGGALGAPLGLMFDGTPVPVTWGIFAILAVSLLIVMQISKSD